MKKLLKSFYQLDLIEIDDFDSDFAKALFEAVHWDHLDILVWIKEHDINVIVKDRYGYTLLHRAAEW